MMYLPVRRRSSTPESSIADEITQPSSPASLLSLDLYGDGSSRAAVYQVVPSCSCYRCVDLSCDRDSGTTDYAIELPLFRRSIIPRAVTWERLQQPSSRASALLTGYFPCL